MNCGTISIEMPHWYESFLDSHQMNLLNTDHAKLMFAVELSKQNVANQTGGPFGAAIFCNHTHKLIAAGVNLVLAKTTSLAHAECVSIGIAQQDIGSHDLSVGGQSHTLYCSAQPCIMCFGAIWWSGLRGVVCAASAEDVEELTGFVEGPVPANWESLLRDRSPLPSVSVAWGNTPAKSAARAVLKSYKDSGAPIYNAGA